MLLMMTKSSRSNVVAKVTLHRKWRLRIDSLPAEQKLMHISNDEHILDNEKVTNSTLLFHSKKN